MAATLTIARPVPHSDTRFAVRFPSISEYLHEALTLYLQKLPSFQHDNDGIEKISFVNAAQTLEERRRLVVMAIFAVIGSLFQAGSFVSRTV
jgi:hypothetical protein